MKKIFITIIAFSNLISLYNCSVTKPISQNKHEADSFTSKEYNGQIWMTENLKAQTDRNGNKILYYFPNNDSTQVMTYGLLYDYETACKVCPKGWHLPTELEWKDLLNYVGKKSANKLKDSSYWNGSGSKFDNSSGFSIRPAGYGNTGTFENLFGTHSVFWSDTKVDSHFVKGFVLSVSSDSMRSAPQHPTYAFSVRCVKDKKK